MDEEDEPSKAGEAEKEKAAGPSVEALAGGSGGGEKAAEAAAVPEAAGKSLASAQRLIEAYYKQVQRGCGAEDCANAECASGGLEPLTEPDKAAAKAIQLVLSHSERGLCAPLAPASPTDSGPAQHCRALSLEALEGLAAADLADWVRTVFASHGLLCRSFPADPEDADEEPLALDLPEAQEVFRRLFDPKRPEADAIRASLVAALSALAENLLRRGPDKLFAHNPTIIKAFILVMELPLLDDMGLMMEAFPAFMRATNLLADRGRVQLVKVWSGRGREWLLERTGQVQQLLTLRLLQTEYGQHFAVGSDAVVVNAVKFLQLLYLASLHGGERDGPERIREEEAFYGPIRADLAALLTAVRNPNDRNCITDDQRGLYRLMGLRRVDCHKPLLPHSEFINQTLSQLLQPDRDFINYASTEGEEEAEGGRFAFISHAWVLEPQVRMEEMYFDSRILMSRHRRRAGIQAELVGAPLEPAFLTIAVSRDDAVRDALGQLELVMQESPADLKKQLRVVFQGEPGVDEGGVSKEFYQIITQRLFDPDYGIFTYRKDTRHFWFRPGAAEESRAELTLIGCLFGLALYNNLILDVSFPLALYLKLFGKLPGLRHLGSLDPTLHSSLQQMLLYDGEDFDEVFCARFEVTFEGLFGESVTEELRPGGSEEVVTRDNRDEYARLYAEFLLNRSVEAEFGAFAKGFWLVTADSGLSWLFGAEEMEELLCGTEDWALPQLRSSTRYENGLSEEEPLVKWFWEVVGEMGREEQRRFLAFVTGSDRVPLGGLSQLRFLVAKNGDDSERLPTAHTCFNVLLLPAYATKERLRERLNKAISYAQGFGLQ